RRLFVLGLVGAVVFVLIGAVRGGDDNPPADGPVATQAAAETSPRPAPRKRRAAPSGDDRRSPGRATQAPPEPVLAEPDGACADSDVLIKPVVEEAVAGRDVAVTLQLRTAEA